MCASQCEGYNKDRTKCKKSVKHGRFCHYHREYRAITSPIEEKSLSEMEKVSINETLEKEPLETEKVSINDETLEKVPLETEKVPSETKIDSSCSICLCDVEKDEDCHLVCGHTHHIECIKNVYKAECPVCRGPLEFEEKPEEVDLSAIKKREDTELQTQKLQADQESITLARELQREDRRRHVDRHVDRHVGGRPIIQGVNGPYQLIAHDRFSAMMEMYAVDIEQENINEAIRNSIIMY